MVTEKRWRLKDEAVTLRLRTIMENTENVRIRFLSLRVEYSLQTRPPQRDEDQKTADVSNIVEEVIHVNAPRDGILQQPPAMEQRVGENSKDDQQARAERGLHVEPDAQPACELEGEPRPQEGARKGYAERGEFPDMIFSALQIAQAYHKEKGGYAHLPCNLNRRRTLVKHRLAALPKGPRASIVF